MANNALLGMAHKLAAREAGRYLNKISKRLIVKRFH
jgi:hypothetical protein